jgi:thioredoxin 1
MVEIKKFEADWCGPCRMLKPTFQKLEGEFGNSVKFSYINVDEQSELAGQYGVRSIPFVVIEKNGEVVQSVVGAQSEMAYSNILKGLL